MTKLFQAQRLDGLGHGCFRLLVFRVGKDDTRTNLLSKDWIAHPDDADVSYGAQCPENRLHLGWRDVLSTADDSVLCPPNDRTVGVTVDRSNIT